MIELSQRLEKLARVSPSPALEPEIVAMRELAAEVGDNAIQAAAQTTVIFVIVLVALGVGLWYNRSEEHTSELQSQSNLVCRLLLEKKKKKNHVAKYITHNSETISAHNRY